MSAEFTVPEELGTIFNRLIQSLPSDLHSDEHTLKITLVYLKIGGQRLARHWLSIRRNRWREQKLMEKHRLREIARLEAVETALEDEDNQTIDTGLGVYTTDPPGPGIELFESYAYDLFALQQVAATIEKSSSNQTP